MVQDGQGRGAAGDGVALGVVETVEERVHRGTVPPGCDSHREGRPAERAGTAEGPE